MPRKSNKDEEGKKKKPAPQKKRAGGKRDDEDDDKEANKKIMEALNSLSEYEKANYHIIFTGNKDKDETR